MQKILIAPEQDLIVAQISSRLQHGIASHLHSLRSNVQSDSVWQGLGMLLEVNLKRLAEHSYRKGCVEVSVSPDAMDLAVLKRQAAQHAQTVVSGMKEFTLASLGIQASKKSLLGNKRAKKVAVHETYVQFYNSRVEAWKKNREIRKSWVLANEHAIDDECDDNDDDGPISPDEPFTTGDLAPPAHLGCYCKLFLHVPQAYLRIGERNVF